LYLLPQMCCQVNPTRHSDCNFPTVDLTQRNIIGLVQIPLPPLEVQKEIVAKIENHQKEIERLKTEIANQEMNIQKEIAHVWGENDEQG
jgi:hypothetical protein